MNKTQQPDWRAIKNPLTRLLAAGCSGRVGEGRRAIPFNDYVNDAYAVFDPLTAENVVRTTWWGGADPARRALAHAVSGLEAQAITEAMEQLGTMAGGDEDTMRFAARTGEILMDRELLTNDRYDQLLTRLCILGHTATLQARLN